MNSTKLFSVKSLPALATLSAAVLSLSPNAHALDQISRAYQSNRSAGMGGVRITTGIFEDNFFSNPARVTANPYSKFVLFHTGLEVANVSNITSVIDTVTNDGDIVKALGNTAGSNTHIRIQEEPFSLFIASNEDRKWALAIGIISSTQIDINLRQSFQIGAQGITDIGPAVTFGYKLLEDKLSVGTTAHVMYRLGTNPNFTFIDLLKGKSLSPTANGGQGMMLDFDLGATYEVPIFPNSGFKYTVGASINNILGGSYTNLGGDFISMTCTRDDATVGACGPVRVSRSVSAGIGASRQTWGVFSDTSFAFEITDFGNNSNDVYAATSKDNPTQNPTSAQFGSGSFFRMIHIGGETHWKFIALRAGLNQGYLAGGLGLDLRFFTLDFATYGEEMSLNAGGIEDRRYALQFGFQI